MDFLVAIIIMVSLISAARTRPTNVKGRLNVLESRVTALESRTILESAYTQELADKISVMNITLEEHESVCHASNKPIKTAVGTDMRQPASFLETEARILTGFKEEKEEIRNTMNKIEKTLSEIQNNMSREVEFEIQAVVYDYYELKNSVENINMSLLGKQEELSSKIEMLSSEFKQDIKLSKQKTGLISDELQNVNQQISVLRRVSSKEMKEFVKEQINDLKTNVDSRYGQLLECPNGWSRYDKFCYRFPHVLANYTEASRKCASSGAAVVDIQSQDEADFVQGLTGNIRYWIGLTDIEKEGTWIWDRTDSIASFLNWRPGQPDNYKGDQECVIAGNESPYIKWNDVRCWLNRYYVCKKSL